MLLTSSFTDGETESQRGETACLVSGRTGAQPGALPTVLVALFSLDLSSEDL